MELFINLVKSRRSIRRYRPDPVPRELVETCLEAARHAPTASNRQGWRFYVAEGDLKDRIARECLGGVVRNAFAKTAPAIVAVAMKLHLVTNRIGGRIKGIDYHVLDAGIAGEHFVLQAAELGLGTCWIGWFDKKAVRRILGIPASWDVPALITLGYPDEAPRPKTRKPLGEIAVFRR
ncbi:MAG: NAD(P)H nitroreductase [Candidatus Latescibacterota bacterium]|jgi:nitroreductase|nr:MAG: NAD(P)H nitroreductase [Candidatus Latescibacterota bacterium]